MKAHELLSDPNKWTQNKIAKDTNGNWTSSYASNAVQWCVFGAIEKCYVGRNTEFWDAVTKLYKSLSFKEHHISIELMKIKEWNDNNNYQTVYNKIKELDI